MLAWISVLCANIAGQMFWPLLIATIPCGLIIAHAFGVRDRHPFGSSENSAATWRMWAAVQGLLIGWIVWGLLSAIPQPDFKTKVITKVVTKTVNVNKAPSYLKAYQECYENQRREGAHDIAPTCKTLVDTAFGTRPVTTKEVTKYVYKADPYAKLYEVCMGKFGPDDEPWNVNLDEKEMAITHKVGADVRNERIAICHKNVMEVRANIL